MTSSSPPRSPDADNDSVIIMDDEEGPEQPIVREAPISLAARFRNLCKTSPSPPPPETPSVLVAPAPPSPERRELSKTSSYRPIVSRPQIMNPLPRVRASQVRSCDQCRTSKQKCDRNLPCATCSMRRIKCTWNQAGAVPAEVGSSLGLASAQLAANRTEIGRLRKEANTLARLLRLTPNEFELFHLEAKRLVEGAHGQPIRLPSLGSKRPRPVEEDYHHHHQQQRGGGGGPPPHKLPRRFDDPVPSRYNQQSPSSSSSSSHRSQYPPIRPATSHSSISRRPIPNYASPQWMPNRSRQPEILIPPVRPKSSSSSRSREIKSTTTSPVLVNAVSRPVRSPERSRPRPRPRPEPQSRSSFSDLPPLKIPSLVGPSTRPVSTLPLRSAHYLNASTPRTSSPTSNSTPRHRRPHYVLPTPVYSSTPTSASFFPLSGFSSSSSPSLSSKPMSASKSWPLYPRYESSTSARVQPYTPLSAVRDEVRELGEKKSVGSPEKEIEKDTEMVVEKEVVRDKDSVVVVKLEQEGGGGGEGTTVVPLPRSASLRNLLND
ncbi:hypothetical protein JCM5350_000991 [Sporobolomyces pararoseus]